MLEADDRLIVESSANQISRLKQFVGNWTKLRFEPVDHMAELIVSDDLKAAEPNNRLLCHGRLHAR
ncbi:MAG: hypothetical protein PVJ84_02795 [Desulfobacteraceae bacterium]